MGVDACFHHGWRSEAAMPSEEAGEGRPPLVVPPPCTGPVAPAVVPPSSAHTHNGVVGAPAPGCVQQPAQTVNWYHLKPNLKTIFNAADKAYTFHEVLLMLKRYLFSNKKLFDERDRSYVNCVGDPLGDALQVDRFHYNDVGLLMRRYLIKVAPPACGEAASNGSPTVPGASTALPTTTAGTTQAAANSSASNDNTRSVHLNVMVVGRQSCSQGTTDLAGPSRGRRPSSYIFQLPDIPDYISEAETVHSGQGCETEYCRNTEDELDEESEWEEYEIATDNNQDEGSHSDDSDSFLEDVGVAVAIGAVCEDLTEEEFWADNSDSGESDTDPDLKAERWDCQQCGLKNTPFVRYCGKCWKVRKDWLPERKKRKRKPRPKKRHRRLRKESLAEAHTIQPSEPPLVTDTNTSPATEEKELSQPLSRTSSSTSTQSSSSQDSGFSQEDTDVRKNIITIFPASNRFITSLKSESKRQFDVDLLEVKDCHSMQARTKRFKFDNSSKDVKEVSKDDVVSGIVKYLHTDSGKEWLMSSEGRGLIATDSFQKKFLMSLESQEGDLGVKVEDDDIVSVMCSICYLHPKNGIIIHGNLGHMSTCYKCARRLHSDGARCPVCRRKIHMVCRSVIT